MKKSLLFIIAICFSISIYAKNKPNKKFVFNMKLIENSITKINCSVYASKYEVSNEMYRYFENEMLKNQKMKEWEIVLPDTSNWLSKLTYIEPYATYYYRHPAYNNYPVVNITHEAANLFCQWLTEQYNAYPKRKFKKVKFRLPYLSEWEYAAKGGTENPYPWGFLLFQNGKYQCNFRKIGEESIVYDSITNFFKISIYENNGIATSLSDNADVTAPVDSYFPNGYKLYNICGNVKEMIDIKGVAKGGGWKNAGGDVMIKSTAYYQKSDCDLGFRYFMQIIDN